MLQTPLLGMKLPDRIYVEVLSKYLEKRIAQAERRFLVIDFPGNENQAAIFEEDVSCLFTPLRFTVRWRSNGRPVLSERSCTWKVNGRSTRR